MMDGDLYYHYYSQPQRPVVILDRRIERGVCVVSGSGR